MATATVAVLVEGATDRVVNPPVDLRRRSQNLGIIIFRVGAVSFFPSIPLFASLKHPNTSLTVSIHCL